jgi:hypothetical protein
MAAALIRLGACFVMVDVKAPANQALGYLASGRSFG